MSVHMESGSLFLVYTNDRTTCGESGKQLGIERIYNNNSLKLRNVGI